MDLLVVLVGVDVGEPALAAVLSVEVGSHEDAGTTLLGGALPEEKSRMSHVTHARCKGISHIIKESIFEKFLCPCLPAKAVDLAVVVHAVIFEDSQLDLLVLVFDLLGGRVILLLALLAAAAQAEHQVKCRLCKDGQIYFPFGNV